MQQEIIKERIQDTADICINSGRAKFFGFLTPEEAVLADRILSRQSIRYGFFGGYEGAMRVVLGCFPDWWPEEEYPIQPLTAVFRKSDTVTHRDILGALMGLGLKRETVGDILTEEGRAVFFVLSEISDYVMNEFTKAGRVGLKTQKGFEAPLPDSGVLKEFSMTVASRRLDCVVSALANISRGRAAEKIEQGFVRLNSLTAVKPTKQINDGDIVAVRGSGKFIVESLCDRTRKDRLVLKYKKYI